MRKRHASRAHKESSMRDKKFWGSVAMAVVLGAPLAASAGEDSNIRLFMERVAGGNEKGMLASHLAPGSAELRVHVIHLAPNLEHILLGDGVVVARFTTNASGDAEVRVDLFKTGGGTTPTFDPRGKLVTVNDGTIDVLAAWVYADPKDDPARPRIKETTGLAREAATQGAVDARYDALPSGGARLAIALRGVAAGDYDVMVDGTTVATVTPNPSGFASVDLRGGPGGGNGNKSSNGHGQPHKARGALTVNPRGEDIDVVLGGVVQFSGEMLAQIPGLGVCTTGTMSANLTPVPAQTSGTGSVALGVETSCDRHMTLTLTNLAAGNYDLLIANVDVGDIAILDAGGGTGSATLAFDEDPDPALSELLMPAGAVTGASIAIQEKMPLGTDVVMTGMLP
jgi:hypothetical protein